MNRELRRLIRDSKTPTTVEEMREEERRVREVLERPAKMEKNKKRFVFVVSTVTTLIFGFLFDKIALLLGAPKEWVVSPFSVVWHWVF